MNLLRSIVLLFCLHFGSASGDLTCSIGYVFNGQDECTKCTFPEISYKIAEKGDVCESVYDLKSTSATQSNLVLKFQSEPKVL